jgi:hypothetical protein
MKETTEIYVLLINDVALFFRKLIRGEWGRRGTLIDYWWESQRERDR